MCAQGSTFVAMTLLHEPSLFAAPHLAPASVNCPFLAAAAHGGDIFSRGYQSYLDKVGLLAPLTYWSYLHCALALGLCLGLCALTFRLARPRVSRGVLMLLEWTVCLLGLLTSMELPISRLPLGRAMKGWAFAFSLLAMATLPYALPWFLAPRAGPRRLLAILLYGGIAVIFTAQLWTIPTP